MTPPQPASPRRRRLWELWKELAKRLGDVQARLLLTVFYFVVVAPFALAVRLAADPLRLRSGAARGWRPRASARGTPLERAQRQS